MAGNRFEQQTTVPKPVRVEQKWFSVVQQFEKTRAAGSGRGRGAAGAAG